MKVLGFMLGFLWWMRILRRRNLFWILSMRRLWGLRNSWLFRFIGCIGRLSRILFWFIIPLLWFVNVLFWFVSTLLWFCRTLLWFISLLFILFWRLWFFSIIVRFSILRFRRIWSLILLLRICGGSIFIVFFRTFASWVLRLISFRRIFIVLFWMRMLISWSLSWSWTSFHLLCCSFSFWFLLSLLPWFGNLLFLSSFFNQILFSCSNFLFSNTISSVPIRTFRAF
jgi:hypothetical protein